MCKSFCVLLAIGVFWITIYAHPSSNEQRVQIESASNPKSVDIQPESDDNSDLEAESFIWPKFFWYKTVQVQPQPVRYHTSVQPYNYTYYKAVLVPVTVTLNRTIVTAEPIQQTEHVADTSSSTSTGSGIIPAYQFSVYKGPVVVGTSGSNSIAGSASDSSTSATSK